MVLEELSIFIRLGGYRKRMNMTYGRIWYIKIVSVVVDTCVNIGKFIGLGKCKE